MRSLAAGGCRACRLSVMMDKLDLRRQSILKTRNPWGKWASEPELRVGLCAYLRVGEENVRLALLALLLIVYLSFGAMLFSVVERKQEAYERKVYLAKLDKFKKLHCARADGAAPLLNCSELDELLDMRGNMSATGLSDHKSSWDFFGSFYFVSTIVTTIGFGMTTPRTSVGKALVIVYGFFGCSSSILFFNLFLERILTFLSFVFRSGRAKLIRLWRRKESSHHCAERDADISLQQADNSDDQYDRSSLSSSSAQEWKPNLYFFWAGLLVISSALITLSSLIYSYAEDWSYLEAAYFCFVSFATIGFGDLISSQQASDMNSYTMYRIWNFVILFFGCCSVYSLFNVTSIVIRSLVNRIIAGLNCQCRPMSKKRRRAKDSLRTLDSANFIGALHPTVCNISSSDGLVGLRDFLDNVPAGQEQLLAAGEHDARKASMSCASVGPMAIVNEIVGGGDP